MAGEEVEAAEPCPRCGRENPVEWRFCTECGLELRSVDGATAEAQPPRALAEGPQTAEPWRWPGPGGARPHPDWPPSGAFTPPPWRWIPDRRDIDRTRNGLVVLAAAALVVLIPLVGVFAYFVLGLVGAVMVFVARASVGPVHRSNVNAAVAAWIIGFVVAIVGAVAAVAIMVSAVSGGTQGAQRALSSFIDVILVTTVITSFLTGLAWVLLPYALVATEGRVFLWAAFGIELASSLALAFFFRDELIATMSRALTTGSADGLNPFGGNVASLQFFSIPPAILYAIAYVMGARRLSRGEVVPRTGPVAARPA